MQKITSVGSSRVKTIAMYLPQFHRTPENDAWWGEGFTEWTAVKAAKPLFTGHNQPRRPLGDYYYDLTEKNSLAWQAQLAAEYGVNGMCFYHYWFKGGQKLLERPAENLLRWRDIGMPFCFCWASGTWSRTWSKIGNWSWSPEFDRAQKDDSPEVRARGGILVEQAYGGRREWEEHIRYLLPFFQDERYIKLDGKPVFVFYGPDGIYCLEEMLACWRDILRVAGLPGLYVIGVNTQMCCPGIDANLRLLNGGRNTLWKYAQPVPGSKLWQVDYDSLWSDYLAEALPPEQKCYCCLTVDYDDTPRRGQNGLIYTGASPEKFGKYYLNMLKRSQADGNELMFINAWNEWGEGMYLEPDTVHGFAYLEALRTAKIQAENNDSDATEYRSPRLEGTSYVTQAMLREYKSKREYMLMHKWMRHMELHKFLADFFKVRNWHRIAIYGMGFKGEHLRQALAGSCVEVVYGVDRRSGAINVELPIYTLEDDLPEVDAVVISVITEYNQIYGKISERFKCPIVSLEEIIYEI